MQSTATSPADLVFTETPAGLKFVGDFEGLYRNEADPWSQSACSGPMASYYDFSRGRLIQTLRPYELSSGIEVGCGHGHLTAELQRRLCVRMTGMDVSPRAIEQAKMLHPSQRFIVGDLLAPDFEAGAQYGFVLWGQVLWYLLHEVNRALKNTLRAIEPGGLFVVSQAFLREQRYGAEIANGFEGALRLFGEYADRLRLIEARYDDSDERVHHDGLMVFRVL